ESLGDKSLFGVLLGFVAVLFSVSWKGGGKLGNSKALLYPLLVFCGMGGMDILFKQVTQYNREIYYVSLFIVFALAMLFGFLILLYKLYFKDEQLDKRAVLWGLGLGLFNFANIYWYMHAHRLLKDNPSIVFTTMDVGGIILGALVGMVFFKDRLSVMNKVGLVLAVLSVLLIYYLCVYLRIHIIRLRSEARVFLEIRGVSL